MQRRERERAELEPLETPVAIEAGQDGRLDLVGANREDRAKRFVDGTPEREIESGRRGRVEPVQIVDRDHQLSLG